MRQRFSLIGSNPLLQRVRRITSMPILYRAPDQTASDLPQSRPIAPSRPVDRAPAVSPPVVATLYRSLDSAAPQPPESAPGARESSRGPLSPVTMPPAQPTAPPPPTTPTTAPPPPTVQAAPAALPRPPATPATPEAGRQQPEQPGQPPASPDDDWGWIDDRQWSNLKTFMAGHQEKAAEEQARQAEIQPSPEQLQRAEAKKQAEADLARRQELARSGRLPRAQVVYLSPEEKAAGSRPIPELPAQPANEPVADKTEAVPAEETTPTVEPSSPETTLRKSTPPAEASEQLTGVERSAETAPPATQSEPEAAPAPAEAPQPPAAPVLTTHSVAQRQMAAAPEVRAPSEKTAPAEAKPAEQAKPAATGSTPNVGRRLMQAARSLFRRKDEDATLSAVDESEPGEKPAADALPSLPQVKDQAAPPVATLPSEAPLPDAPPGRAAGAKTEAGPAPAHEAATAVPPPPGQIGRETSPAPQIARLPESSQPPTPAQEPTPAAQEPAPVTQFVAEPARPRPEVESEPAPAVIDAPRPLPDLAAESPDDVPEPEVRSPDLQRELAAEPHSTTDEDAGLFKPAVQPDSALAGPAASQAPVATGFDESDPATIDDDQDLVETVIAPVPLQQVWQVEERPAPPPSSRPTPQSKAALPAVQRKPAGGDSIGEEVHSALREVAPGKGTDSSIELVTPRRPRPVVPAPLIRRQADDKPPPDEQQSAPPPADYLPQASAEPAPVRQPATEPQMVPTEIGELPSDLWGLLGERPPSPGPGRPDMPAATTAAQRAVAGVPASAGVPTLAKMPAEAGSTTATQTMVREPAGQVTQFFAPPAIQRVDSEPRAGAGEVVDDSESVVTEDESKGDQGPDIDELARKILPEIKRRLAIDWERGRGRLR